MRRDYSQIVFAAIGIVLLIVAAAQWFLGHPDLMLVGLILMGELFAMLLVTWLLVRVIRHAWRD